jgi:hypothetical protein
VGGELASLFHFAWPSFELTGLYWQGKYADETKLKENLERFYALCPSWVEATYFGNQIEGFKMRKDLPLVAKTVLALRADLAQQTAPKRLEDYKILWQREFLTRPPSDHDAPALSWQVRRFPKRKSMFT